MAQFDQAYRTAPDHSADVQGSAYPEACSQPAKCEQPREEVVRVLVCDTSRLGLQLLKHALESSHYSFNIVAAEVESSAVVDAARNHCPDVALISADLHDGPQKGLKAVRELRAQLPQVRSIVLVDADHRDVVLEAFRSGAKGVCARNESLEILRKCIYSVHRGQVWANSSQLQVLLEAVIAASPVRLVNVNGKKLLTDREEQVAYFVAEGLTNREISEKMHLSEHTVKNYLFRIFDKLGISNRVELILYTLQQRGRAA